MPFAHEWYIPQHIARITFYGELTTRDIEEAFKISGQYIDESNARAIHFLHDWSRLTRLPANLKELRQSFSFPLGGIRLGKLGMVIVYGVETETLRLLGDLIFQYLRVRAQMTGNLESALAILRAKDATIFDAPQTTSTAVSWHLKSHILYCYGVITSDDMLARNINAARLIEADGKPPFVHLIIDYSISKAEDYPTDIRNLIHRSESSEEFERARDQLVTNPLFGWVVAIGSPTRNIEVGATIVAARNNYRRKEVANLNEAITFLKQVDPNIAKLLNK